MNQIPFRFAAQFLEIGTRAGEKNE